MKKILLMLLVFLTLAGCSAAKSQEQTQENSLTELEIGEFVFTADYLHPKDDYWISDLSDSKIFIEEVDKSVTLYDAFKLVKEKAERIMGKTFEVEEYEKPSRGEKTFLRIPEEMCIDHEKIMLNYGDEKYRCEVYIMSIEEEKNHVFAQVEKVPVQKNYEIKSFLESIEFKNNTFTMSDFEKKAEIASDIYSWELVNVTKVKEGENYVIYIANEKENIFGQIILDENVHKLPDTTSIKEMEERKNKYTEFFGGITDEVVNLLEETLGTNIEIVKYCDYVSELGINTFATSVISIDLPPFRRDGKPIEKNLRLELFINEEEKKLYVNFGTDYMCNAFIGGGLGTEKCRGEATFGTFKN